MSGLEIFSAGVVFRLLKLTALAVTAGGLLAALGASTRRERLVATYVYTVPGFVVTWAAGWGLMRATGHAITEPWILGGIAASLVALIAVFRASHRGAPSRIEAPLAIAGLFVAIALMCVRTAEPIPLVLASVPAAAIGALLAWPLRSREVATAEHDAVLVWRGFRWLAFAEGGSLLFLLLVSIPVRRLLGVSLDGGTGLFGWIHGMLVIAYLVALTESGRVLGWSRGRLAAGVGAALVPFAAFAFERRVRPPRER